MRFASAGGSNASNYIAAGKAVADSAAKTFATQRKYGPDYAGLSKVAMAAQTAENIAATQAEATKLRQRSKQLQQLRLARLKVNTLLKQVSLKINNVWLVSYLQLEDCWISI